MAAVNEPAFGPELTSRDVREFESEQFCSVTVIDGAYIYLIGRAAQKTATTEILRSSELAA
jgi:hypothetical protein